MLLRATFQVVFSLTIGYSLLYLLNAWSRRLLGPVWGNYVAVYRREVNKNGQTLLKDVELSGVIYQNGRHSVPFTRWAGLKPYVLVPGTESIIWNARAPKTPEFSNFLQTSPDK